MWFRLSALMGTCVSIAIAATSAQAGVTYAAIGTPGYAPVDFHLFAAPIGTAANGYADVATTLQTLLPPPNHQPNPTLGIGPGAPHPGPYNQELAHGVAAGGFVDSSTFSTTQYSNGVGVYLAFMLVPSPGSPVESSPDFPAGPILPNAIFPLSSAVSTLTNGILNDL